MKSNAKLQKLDVPIQRMATIKDAYDVFLAACLHPNPDIAMRDVLEQFEKFGISEKQTASFKRKALAMGIALPAVLEMPSKKLEHIVIEPDPKFAKLDKQGTATGQDLANKFSMFIYGKMFNDGIHGAFGKKQSIRGEAKNKIIVLRSETPCQFPPKLKNSIQHYKSQGHGQVRIEIPEK